jgi:hypothetical protein
MDLCVSTRESLLQALGAVQSQDQIDSYGEMVRIMRACLAQATVRDRALEFALDEASNAIIMRKSRRLFSRSPVRTGERH